MMNKFATFSALTLTLLSAVSTGAYASTDARIEGAKMCTQYIPSNERQYGIPSHLLSAISSTESGRYHEGLKIVLPWPWTINVEGKGYFFDSKADAIAAVRKYQAQGKKSIDVGCMQVNLMHHPNAFSNLEQAFDPKYNIAYAASFVRSLYEEEHNWKKAAAGYHSRTPARGNEYVGLVFQKWENIINRLRLSKSDTIQKASAGFDGKSMTPAEPRKQVAMTNNITPRVPAAKLSEQEGKALPQQSQVKMKVINVSDSSRNNGIMIVKPDLPATEVAQTADKPIVLASVDTADSKIIRMDKVSHTSTVAITSPTPSKNGPRFIFSD